MKKTIPILLSAALLLSACGQAAGTAETTSADAPAAVTETTAQTSAPKTTPGGVDKAETVYAKANADGTVTETTVEAVLKARDGATIEDVAALRDIINKEGDETYTTGADNALTWENSGNAITYEGKSDAALPVTTRVTYYLNGVETAPADLAGQSGRVRIRFDYTNHTRETVTVDGQEYTVCVPFTAITAVILDGDKFSNIEADNGKVMELDGTTAVLGAAMPGLADSLRLTEFEPLEDTEIPAYFEVSADVTDFSLDFTATILTPSALDDLDTGDLSDLDDLSDTLDDLTDAADELADGVQALYDGFHEYANGVQGLNEGAEALADGLTQLYDSGTALVDGANALRDGLSAVSGAFGGMTSGDTGSNDEMMAQLDEQLAPVISNYGTTVVTDTVTDADLLAALTAAGLTVEQQQAVLGAVGVAMGKALQNDTPAMVQGVAGTVSGVLMGQLGSGISQLQTGLDQLASGSAEQARGADTYVKAVGQVSQRADALAEGSAKLDDASDAMYEGLAELHDGAAELHDGVQEFSDKNTDDLSDDLRNVVHRLKAVQQAGKNYQTFSGLHNGDTGSVKFIVETAEIKK